MCKSNPTTDPQAKLAVMLRHPFFEGLPNEIVQLLAKRIITKKYPRNALIIAKGDPGDALILVYSGIVRIDVQSHDGRDALLRLLTAGDFFGEIALIDGLPRTADAHAHSDCELLVIRRRDLIPIIENHPPLMWRLLKLLCMRLRKTTEQFEDRMFVDLAGRLARTLLDLTTQSDGGGRICITQSEIAKIAGFSREMTNKQLRIWARKNWIALARKEIIVNDVSALAKIAPARTLGD